MSRRLLSDQSTHMLVDPLGRVSWGGGEFVLVPLEGKRLSQAYDGDTMIVRTVYEGIEIVDHLDATCEKGSRLVRRVQGRGTLMACFSPRAKDTSMTLTSSHEVNFEMDGKDALAHVEVEGFMVFELLLDAEPSARTEKERRHETARAQAQWTKALGLPTEDARRDALTLWAFSEAPANLEALLAVNVAALPDELRELAASARENLSEITDQ